MRVVVVGAGYAGLVSAVGFAGRGHSVHCIDLDAGKVSRIQKGVAPFFEEGLGERMRSVLDAQRLTAGTDFAAARDADIVIIAVGTPMLADGSADLAQVRSACAAVAGALAGSGRFIVVAMRSTVPPGTTERVAGRAMEAAGVRCGLAMVPEFLREGSAMADFDSPDRVVVGCSGDEARKVMEELYGPFSCPKLFTDIRTAEMIKYVSNVMLASRVATVNEVANICQRVGVDADAVLKGVGMDARIGPHYLVPGSGFGGSCLPKDVNAIAHRARELGEETPLLHAIAESNSRQKLRLFRMLERLMPPKGKKVAVLGLAFKGGTDDIRESPAIPLIERLLEAGAHVRAYDPEAMGRMQERFPPVEYCDGWEECLSGCDAALLVTAWPEFRKSAAEYKEALKAAPLIDGRRIISREDAERAGLDYHALGRGSP
jgi:UDPglucose 6-dehydrogenase